ncbi:hypothetical protein KIN20_025245 [Parelaphostrongylus tenuis]|uniref:Uncharacterized protein n=1 Tax=Parelaphostrongylus tenuis TaxID=148309 RepID=A0AAD5QX70_PARTN|nr:hypothetical protein KIN20_025245 [Parelaphostrongylus tenuis]
MLALYFPIVFRRLCSRLYAKVCLLLGLLLGALDSVLEFSTTPLETSKNCPSIGCFLTQSFLHYLGLSNMVLGFVVIILTAFILFKLRLMRQQTQIKAAVTTSRDNNLEQVNRSCAGILLTSLVFVTFPSVAVGVCAIIGYNIASTSGPMYFCSLLCSGVCNNIVHVVLNKKHERFDSQIHQKPCAG